MMLSKQCLCFIGLPRKFHSAFDTVTRNKIASDILANTKLTRNHLTPEIALRLITPECKIFSEPFLETEKIFKNDPFWGFYWPGGQALSRYLLDNPDIVKNKRVLDVGSGSGACSIAAAMCEAKYAVANDIDEVASVAAELNAELNNVEIHTSCDNLIGTSCSEDIVLLGDLFYDSEFAAIIVPWLEKLRNSRKQILIGDPGRHGLTGDCINFLRKVATYDLPDNCCVENNGFKQVYVWEFN